MKKITFIITAILLTSCQFGNKKEKQHTEKKSVTNAFATKENDSTKEVEYVVSIEDLPLQITEISEEEFLTAKKKAVKGKPIKLINDVKQAIPLLKGIVDFRDKFVHSIRFANGYTYEAEEGSLSFQSYYPAEEVLICDAASIDLKTGRTSERMELKDSIAQSPNGKYRIKENILGQRCMGYVIEKKHNNKWEKIIDFNKMHNRITKGNYCYLDFFWVDNQTFYIEEAEYVYEGTMTYQKVTLIPTLNTSKLVFEEKYTQLPCRVKVGVIDEDFPSLDKEKAKKLLGGLFPQAEEAKFLHRLPISPKYTSVVVSFKRSDVHKLYTVLFNINEKDEIIDYLNLSSYKGWERYPSIIINTDEVHYISEGSEGERYENLCYISPEGYFIYRDYDYIDDNL